MSCEASVRRGLPTIMALGLVAVALCVAAWWLGGVPPAPTDIGVGGGTGIGTGTITAMTANVRIAEPTDGVNVWPNRREFMVKTFLKYMPAVIGCQEVSPAQGAYLTKELAKWYGHYPQGGLGKIGVGPATDESAQGTLVGTVNETFASLNTLFYRLERFELIDGEARLVFPDEMQNDPAENTFYTLAVLKEKEWAKQQNAAMVKPGIVIVVDTHLRHRAAFAVKCAARIREKIGEMRRKYPGADVVVMGDMNHDRSSVVYATLTGEAGAMDGAGMLKDSFDYSRKRPGEGWGNWHGFTGKAAAEWPTDLIFSGIGLKARGTEIVRDRDEKGHYPSDHFFVMTELEGE